jgi:hypothetical protein
MRVRIFELLTDTFPPGGFKNRWSLHSESSSSEMFDEAILED